MNLADLQALDILLRLPEDAALTVEEAAVVLRLSVRQLERMRSPDSTTQGPPYIQAGGKIDRDGNTVRAVGTNQKVLYLKGDLLAWQQANRVSNSAEAAIRKGQMFRTLADVMEPVAFWRDTKGEIAGLVDETSIDVFLARLGKWQIEWLPADEAAAETWSDQPAHHAFAKAVSDVLSAAQRRISDAVEKTAVAKATEGGDERKPVRPGWKHSGGI